MDNLAFYTVDGVITAAITTLTLGTVAPSSSDDIMLRLVNTSDLYQAEDITVSVTGDDAVQLWLSTDGDTFTSSITVGDLPAGGASPVFWLRRVTASTEAPGDCEATLSALPAGWTSATDPSTTANIPLDTEDS